MLDETSKEALKKAERQVCEVSMTLLEVQALDGDGPIFSVAEGGNLDVVRLLLDHFADAATTKQHTAYSSGLSSERLNGPIIL